MVEPGVILEGRFTLIREIGKGDYGKVILALDTETKRKRAVKMVSKIGHDEKNDVTLATERNALLALNDFNGTPRLYCFGETDNFRYLVLDVLEGDLEQLRHRNEGNIFKMSTTFKLLWHIIHALKIIHSIGILHRDIKLANIMIRRRKEVSRVVLVDFGVSQGFRDKFGSRLELKGDGLDFSSCCYAAPRAAQGLAYQETEDLIITGYATLFMRDTAPWFDRDKEKLMERKIKFGLNPSAYLHGDEKALAPVLKEMNSQTYGEDPNYRKIMNLVLFELILMNETTVIDSTVMNGILRLE